MFSYNKNVSQIQKINKENYFNKTKEKHPVLTNIIFIQYTTLELGEPKQ